MIGLIGCSLVALAMARPQNPGGHAAARPSTDTTGQTQQHSVISRDTTLAPTRPDTSFRYKNSDSTIQIKDSVISLADDAPATPAGNNPAASTGNNPAASTGNNPAAPAGNNPAAPTAKTDTTKPAEPAKTESIDLAKPDSATQQHPDPTTQQQPDATAQTAKPKEPADTTQEDRDEQQKHGLDRRWFIAPLTKFQFQDFAFLEKNRKGYQSDATSLPFFQRGNASFAASAYKNLTDRLSVSADIGLSFGHATSNDVLISQTKSKTYNLLNASLYYHLISPAYRLQPYVTIGFNDIVNDKSYPTVPMGIGAKFNSRKVMVLGQITYGQSISHNVASTTMYSVGIYIPIKSKKQKQLDDDKSGLNKKDKDEAKKKDSTNKNGGGNVTNNIYITINMDSVLKAKGLLDDNGNPFTAGGGRKGRGDDEEEDAAAARARRKKAFRNIGLDDFDENDYKVDSMDGKPVIRFVVYFEFNDYGLNSKAFGGIDKVIRHLRSSSEFSVEIKGYTDSVGTDQYNNLLSRKRAKMVLDYMNSRGVPANLMKAKAYGSDSPVADNSDPNMAWLNRRAEIVIHKKELASQ